MSASAQRRPSAGLTLVELMIAMGLTALVAVMLLAAAQVQTSLQQQNQGNQQTQDNLRSAMETLVSGVRIAGSSFYTGQAANAIPPNNPNPLGAIRVINANNAPDRLMLLLTDDTAMVTVVETPPTGTNRLSVDSNPGFRNGDFVALSDFNQATIYRLTQNPAGGSSATVPALPVTWLYVNPAPVGSPVFARGSMVTRLNPITYSIDTAIFNAPILIMQERAPLDPNPLPVEIIADNIEDMQIALWVDGLAPGTANCIPEEIGKAVNDDEFVHNFAGEVLPQPLPAGARIAGVRITLVGRTTETQNPQGMGRPAAEDRPAGGQDGYRRRVLTTLVTLRTVATTSAGGTCS